MAFYGAGKAVEALAGSIWSNKGDSSSKYYNSDESSIWPSKGILYTERALPIGTDPKPYTVFEISQKISELLQ